MNKAALKRMTRRTEFYMFLVLIVLIAAVGIISKGSLFEPTQVVTILRAMVVDGMFALGCLVVMISGGFDMSFPALAARAYSLATTIGLNNGWCQTSPIAAFALSVIFGAILGMFNGWIISNFKLNTMLVTLGTQTFFTGLVVIGAVLLDQARIRSASRIRVKGENTRFSRFKKAFFENVLPLIVPPILHPVLRIVKKKKSDTDV